MIKAICFDLDDTLYDYKGFMLQCEYYLCEITCGMFGIPLKDCQRAYSLMKKNLYQSRPTDPAIFDFTERISGLLVQLGDKPGQETVEGLFNDFWNRFLSIIDPYPDAVPTIETIRRSGIRTAIISNGTRWQQAAKVRKLGLSKHFDVQVFSEDVGRNKPDPAIFRRALADLDVPAEESLMVGDLCHVDIKGAKNVGMLTCLLSRWARADLAPKDTMEEPDFKIGRLTELGSVLEAL